MRTFVIAIFAVILAVSVGASADAASKKKSVNAAKDAKCKSEAHEACMPSPRQACVIAAYRQCMAH
jgi:hypothetical protein